MGIDRYTVNVVFTGGTKNDGVVGTTEIPSDLSIF